MSLIAALLVHWLLFGLALAGTLNPLFNDSHRRLSPGADFFALYQAGREVTAGCSIYRDDPVCDPAVPYRYPYRYLPFPATVLGVPLAQLPAWTAYRVWVAVLEILFLTGLVLTWHSAVRWRSLVPWLWALLTPFYLEIVMGQFSFMMGMLIAASALVADRARPGVAVGFWTASLLLKSNSFLAAPLWVRLAGPRLVIAGLVVVATLNVPYFLLVSGSYDAFRANLDVIAAPAQLNAGAQGLQSLLSIGIRHATGRPLTTEIEDRIPFILTVGVLVLLVTIATVRRPDPILSVLATTALFFLIYPDVWEHQYSMLVPLLAVALVRRPKASGLVLAGWILLALPTPYLVFDTIAQSSPRYAELTFDSQPLWPAWGAYFHHALKPAAAALTVTGALLSSSDFTSEPRL